MGDNTDIRVEVFQPRLRDRELAGTDVFRAEQHLALKVRNPDHVEIDQPEAPHPRGSEVQGDGGPETAGPDNENAGRAQRQLAIHPDIGQSEMAGIALDLGW